jgi:hypothetical protein
VGGKIVNTQVGFGLNDPPSGLAVNQNLAEAAAGHLDRLPRIEFFL